MARPAPWVAPQGGSFALRAPFVRLTRFAQRFARDESGAVTVEAVLWIPFFFFVLMLITDASLAFYARAQAYRVVEDALRQYSIGKLASEGATDTYIEDRFKSLAPNVNATTSYDTTTRLITTEMDFPARNVVRFNTLRVVNSWKIRVRAQQYKEWPL